MITPFTPEQEAWIREIVAAAIAAHDRHRADVTRKRV
jgi:hypothetical protein